MKTKNKKFIVTVAFILIISVVHASERPNFVIIMADDLGFSDLGSYGGHIHTPNLDRLAENGLRFTQFYNTGRCAPTRVSLLTGLYPHHAGIGLNTRDNNEPGYTGRLTSRTVTIPEVLQKIGYRSFVSGKWHLSHWDYDNPYSTMHPPSWPLQRGFDRFFGTLSGAGSYFSPVSLMSDNEFIEPGDDFYYTDQINDQAARFIEEADPDSPLFLYISHVAPHWPLHALQQDIDKYDGVFTVGWDILREKQVRRQIEEGLIDEKWVLSERDHRVPSWDDADHKEWEAHRKAVYAAQIDNMDQGIGRVIESLKKTDRYENTLILFFSDNGGDSGTIQGRDTRHGYFERGGTRPDVFPGGPDTYASYGMSWANVSNTPFRLYKTWNHEGGIAGPFIAHWPAGIEDIGTIRHQQGHVMDIMATIIDISGAEYPELYRGNNILPLDGISLLPAFRNKSLDRDALFWEHRGNRAVRSGKWKLVAMRDKPWELYDMQADRTETDNLADNYPELVAELAAMWQEWAERTFVLRTE